MIGKPKYETPLAKSIYEQTGIRVPVKLQMAMMQGDIETTAGLTALVDALGGDRRKMMNALQCSPATVFEIMAIVKALLAHPDP